MQTVVHVTHEAIDKIGGIGAVLHGLFTSRVYLDRLPRNILVGPFWPTDGEGEKRLGPSGEVLYSSLDQLYRSPLASRFREIEETFGVGIVYGRRKFVDRASGVVSTPETLLIDVARAEPGKVAEFKFDLWNKFGIDSQRYENIWDYEQYVRLARPALAALHALGVASASDPCIVVSHEYMGIPTVLAAILEGERANLRTIFWAHETATIRKIVEGHPGHDTMFYNVMRAAMPQGQFVEDVFGDQTGFYKHGLLKSTRYCDEIFAVGDWVQKEFRFLGPDFIHVDSQLAYNGVPCTPVSLKEKLASRQRLRTYTKNLLGFEPDYILTHVTRLVLSKGLWRDLRVLEHLDKLLAKRNETAVLLVLSTEVPGRRGDDIRNMEKFYGWPVVHREGLPDLSNGEAVFYQGVQEFMARSWRIKVVFVNQFGFEAALCGNRMPADMEFMDIRKGSDAEFGQSIYEPFGIAQVEPIAFGGICVYSNVCGCAGFVAKAAGGDTPNVIVADYTRLHDPDLSLPHLLAVGHEVRNRIEHEVSQDVARQLLERMPRSPGEFEAYLERGYALAQKMSWDVVARDFILPGIERASRHNRLKQIA